MSFHIWVDADSCPRLVRDFIVQYSLKLSVPVVFVANRPIPVQSKTEFFSMIICDSTSGAADDYIAAHAENGDIAVTRDIPLAARLVDKKIIVLNDRGQVYSAENIKERLSERDFSLQLAQIGLTGDKRNTYSKKEFALFANCFDREIHRALKNHQASSSSSG